MQAPMSLRVDWLEECFQIGKHFVGRIETLNVPQTPEQPRQLAPMTLGKFPFNVSLFMDQATLQDRIRKGLDHCTPKGIAAVKDDKQALLTTEATSRHSL